MTNRALSADTARATALEESETKIRSAFRRTLMSTCEIAKELHKILEGELYTLKTPDFTEYVTDYLNINIVTYRRIVAVSQTVAQFRDAGLPLPENETIAAELSRLEAGLRPKVWNELVIQAERQEKTLTAEEGRRAVDAVLTPIRPAITGGIEVDMDSGDNGTSAPAARKPKPQVQDQEAQLILTEKGEAALARIKKVCGKQIAEAITSGTLAMTERELRHWAEYDDEMMKTLVYYLVSLRWTLLKAVAFENREISESTDVHELLLLAYARSGLARVNYQKAKITVELEA